MRRLNGKKDDSILELLGNGAIGTARYRYNESYTRITNYRKQR